MWIGEINPPSGNVLGSDQRKKEMDGRLRDGPSIRRFFTE
jgi:hypothetical protein